MRILHTADWQLGRRFGQFSEDAGSTLSQVRYEVVPRIFSIAQQHAAALILVAGDIFDSQTLSDQSLRRGMQLISESPVPIVLLPGNHDADMPGGVWDRVCELSNWPAHVHVLRASQSEHALVLHEHNVVICGAALSSRHAAPQLRELFARQLSAAVPAHYIKLGLAHGGVLGVLPDTVSISNPIAADTAQSLGLDYLALGDWHGTLQVNDRTAYAGTPEPDRFRNNERGQVLLVDLEAHQLPIIKAIKSAAFDWQSHHLTLQSTDDALSAIKALAQSLQEPRSMAAEQSAAALRRIVLQLEISGSIDHAAQQAMLREIQALEAKVHALSLDMSDLSIRASDTDLSALHDAGYVLSLAQQLTENLSAPESVSHQLESDALAILLEVARRT
jgi:DNA repair exonuclease SbcCD nuclease subunit